MQISSHRSSRAIGCAKVLNCRLPSHINIKLLACTDLLNNWILNLIRGALQKIRCKEPRVSLGKQGTSGSLRVCGSSWEVPERKQIPNPTPDTLQGKHWSCNSLFWISHSGQETQLGSDSTSGSFPGSGFSKQMFQECLLAPKIYSWGSLHETKQRWLCSEIQDTPWPQC